MVVRPKSIATLKGQKELRPRRWWKIALAAAAILALGIYAPFGIDQFYAAALNHELEHVPENPAFTAQTRLLIVAPHPDDESLACAGAIQHCLAAGGQVWLVWLTSGGGFEWDEVLMAHKPLPAPQDM